MIKLNTIVDIEKINKTDLTTCQKAVGGYIQILGEKNDMHVYCNSEGMLKGLNPSAYIPAFLKYMGFNLYCGDYVYGNVIITKDQDVLTEHEIQHIKEKQKEWKKTLDF